VYPMENLGIFHFTRGYTLAHGMPQDRIQAESVRIGLMRVYGQYVSSESDARKRQIEVPDHGEVHDGVPGSSSGDRR